MGIKSKGKSPASRHQPLAQQLASDQTLTKRARRAKADADGSAGRARPSDDARMLDLARSQLDEIAAEEAAMEDDRGEGPSRLAGRGSDDEDEDDELGDEDEEVEYYEELVRIRPRGWSDARRRSTRTIRRPSMPSCPRPTARATSPIS